MHIVQLHTSLSSSSKGLFYQNQLFFVCDVAEVFFLLKLNFLLFVWHSAHIVGALKVQVVICSIQVRNLHKMYFAASCEMQFGDVELYVFVFFQFWGNVKQQIFFFFAN